MSYVQNFACCLFALTVCFASAIDDKVKSSPCVEPPEGAYSGEAYVQANPDDAKRTLMFRSIISVTKSAPNVFTGQGIVTGSGNLPEAPTFGVPVPNTMLMVQDPVTCTLATALYNYVVPFNDIMHLSFDGSKLVGFYMGSVNGTILTATLSRFEATYLGPQ